MKVLDQKYVLKNYSNGVAKVTLKKSKVKGTSLIATKTIQKNQVIAYYKFTVFRQKGFKSQTDNMYTFAVHTKNDNVSNTLIGDLTEDSLEQPKRGIPFWGHFANEPSGRQTPNSFIDTNLAENYKNKSRLSPGDSMIYKLRAERTIHPGEEIVWCYGQSYLRDYDTTVC